MNRNFELTMKKPERKLEKGRKDCTSIAVLYDRREDLKC